MLFNLCGAHGPASCATWSCSRTVAGHTGIGEVPGGEGIRQALERSRELVVGTAIGRYQPDLNTMPRARRAVAARTAHQVTSEAEAAVLLQPHEINLRMDNVRHRGRGGAARSAGAAPRMSRFASCSAPANSATAVRMLAYLFYIGDRARTDLPYIATRGARDDWYRAAPRGSGHARGRSSRQAEAAAARYGFRDFKLKGGVMRGEDEMQAVAAIKRSFPRRG